jgi:hypothetical protein
MPKPLLLQPPALRHWATAQVARHGRNFTQALAQAFGVTRAAAAPAVRQLELEGFVRREGGSTRPIFSPGPSRWIQAQFVLPGVDESLVWEQSLAPWLELSASLENIVHFGVTEMVNNANDHSGGTRLDFSCAVAGDWVYITVKDDGVGLFERMASTLNLSDRRLALLELSKGRITSDPANHSGEGIFFTSRAFAAFRIEANGIAYERFNAEPGATRAAPRIVLPGAGDPDTARPGTAVFLAARLLSQTVLREVFNRYTTGAPDDLSFDRTVIPMRLARLASENLLSRSQAKRVISGIDKFRVVELDFEGVPEIGQAFADELFRVFAQTHPAIDLRVRNAGPGVLPMIRRVQGA